MKRNLFLAIICTILVCLNGTSNAAKPQSKREMNLHGRALYMANCEACHMMGMNVIKPGKEIVKSDKLISIDIFRKFLSEKHGIMPPFNDISQKEEACKNLYYFVKKLKKQAWEYVPDPNASHEDGTAESANKK